MLIKVVEFLLIPLLFCELFNRRAQRFEKKLVEFNVNNFKLSGELGANMLKLLEALAETFGQSTLVA